MIKKLILLLFISPLSYLNAQVDIDFNHYHSLTCKGEIPDIFKVKTNDKIPKNLSENDTNLLKELVKEFSNITLKKILYSGKVSFGDPLTNYVNKVADNALSSDKDLRSKLNFFIYKSDDVNAFTLANGCVFITLGLLSKIEDENQLALVICHEAVHYRDNHLYLEAVRKNILKERFGTSFSEVKFKRILNYSIELENDADIIGFNLLSKSNYSTAKVEHLFETFLYAQYPFANIEFNKEYFNQKLYNVPGRYFLNTTKKYPKNQLANNPLSDHPSAAKRQEKITRLNEKQDKQTGIFYCNSREHFLLNKKIAQFEIAEIQLKNGELIDALYTVFLLENLYGNSQYLNKIKAQILYAAAKTKTIEQSQDFISRKVSIDTLGSKWQRVSGNIQSLYYFFNSMPAKELNVLAMSQLYQLYLEQGENYYLIRLKDLCYDLQTNFNLKKKDFIESRDSNTIEGQLDIERDYYNFAFLSFDIQQLKEVFNETSDKIDAENEKKKSNTYPIYIAQKNKIIEQFGPALDIKEITIFNPSATLYRYNYVYFDSFYYQIPVRETNFTLIDQVALELHLKELMTQYGKDNNVKIHFIDFENFKTYNSDSLNDYSLLVNLSNEISNYKNPTTLTYYNSSNNLLKSTNYFIGKLNLEVAYNNTKITFQLLDTNQGKELYLFEKELQNCNQENVKTRAIIYEIIDHIGQTPDKINSLKLKYHINE